ncbi:MAG: hypothetical protein JOY60_12275 [Burkholderiaceae bacterium]|nr:hypothetical protein [Roseateles sp.]MBV8470621.1 hypothetical protein [Burkholderiaceae bacterium]
MTLPRAQDSLGKVEQWRQSFDLGFSEPRAELRAGSADYLAVQVGGRDFALCLKQIAALHPWRGVVSCPSECEPLLGLGDIANVVMPVYALPRLMGLADAASPGWLVVMQAAPCALAFDAFQQFLRLGPEARIHARDPAEGPRHAFEMLQVGVSHRPLIDLSSVLDSIQALIQGPIV